MQPLLETRCTGCHSSSLSGGDRNGAPPSVNLDSYAGLLEVAELANTRVQQGAMPPLSGGLAASERMLFQAWIDDGMLE